MGCRVIKTSRSGTRLILRTFRQAIIAASLMKCFMIELVPFGCWLVVAGFGGGLAGEGEEYVVQRGAVHADVVDANAFFAQGAECCFER